MGKIWRRILIGIVILAAIIGIVAKLLEPEEYTNTKPRQNTECTITQRVLDEAGKMTDKQKKNLEALIAEKEQLIGCDIVIVMMKSVTMHRHIMRIINLAGIRPMETVLLCG